MKIETGKEYRTRSGHEVRIYATDGAGAYPVHGAIRYEDGWVDETWASGGNREADGPESCCDLVSTGPTHRVHGWLAAHRTDDGPLIGFYINEPNHQPRKWLWIREINEVVPEGEGVGV